MRVRGKDSKITIPSSDTLPLSPSSADPHTLLPLTHTLILTRTF